MGDLDGPELLWLTVWTPLMFGVFFHVGWNIFTGRPVTRRKK